MQNRFPKMTLIFSRILKGNKFLFNLHSNWRQYNKSSPSGNDQQPENKQKVKQKFFLLNFLFHLIFKLMEKTLCHPNFHLKFYFMYCRCYPPLNHPLNSDILSFRFPFLLLWFNSVYTFYDLDSLLLLRSSFNFFRGAGVKLRKKS